MRHGKGQVCVLHLLVVVCIQHAHDQLFDVLELVCWILQDMKSTHIKLVIVVTNDFIVVVFIVVIFVIFVLIVVSVVFIVVIVSCLPSDLYYLKSTHMLVIVVIVV